MPELVHMSLSPVQNGRIAKPVARAVQLNLYMLVGARRAYAYQSGSRVPLVWDCSFSGASSRRPQFQLRVPGKRIQQQLRLSQ